MDALMKTALRQAALPCLGHARASSTLGRDDVEVVERASLPLASGAFGVGAVLREACDHCGGDFQVHPVAPPARVPDSEDERGVARAFRQGGALLGATRLFRESLAALPTFAVLSDEHEALVLLFGHHGRGRYCVRTELHQTLLRK